MSGHYIWNLLPYVSKNYKGVIQRLAPKVMKRMETAELSWEWSDVYICLFQRCGLQPPEVLREIAAKNWGFCANCGNLMDSEDGPEWCDWIEDSEGQPLRCCSIGCLSTQMRYRIVPEYGKEVWDRLEADLEWHYLKRWNSVSWMLDRIEDAQIERDNPGRF